MAYMDQVDCPHCGARFYHETPEVWKAQLPEFLAFFSEMVTPIETYRLMKAGMVVRIWNSPSTGQRRRDQLVREGYITSPTHGWWTLTDKGIACGQSYRQVHPDIPHVEGVNDPIGIPGPTLPGRNDQQDNVRTPSDWQIGFMEMFLRAPRTLVSIPAVIRWVRKEGLGKTATSGIRGLIGDGWLGWAGKSLALTEPAKRFLIKQGVELPGDLPVVEPIKHPFPTRVPNPWDDKEKHPLADVHKK